MIPIPTGVRIWIATGHTDMRRGMRGLALQVQERLTQEIAEAMSEVVSRCSRVVRGEPLLHDDARR